MGMSSTYNSICFFHKTFDSFEVEGLLDNRTSLGLEKFGEVGRDIHGRLRSTDYADPA